MTIKNMAASVRARLSNIARETDRPFQEELPPLKTLSDSCPNWTAYGGTVVDSGGLDTRFNYL